MLHSEAGGDILHRCTGKYFVPINDGRLAAVNQNSVCLFFFYLDEKTKLQEEKNPHEQQINFFGKVRESPQTSLFIRICSFQDNS